MCVETNEVVNYLFYCIHVNMGWAVQGESLVIFLMLTETQTQTEPYSATVVILSIGYVAIK